MGSAGYIGERRVITEWCWDNARKRLRSGEVLMGDCSRTVDQRDYEDTYFFIGPIAGWYSNGNYVVRGDVTNVVQTLAGDLPDYSGDLARMGDLAYTKARAKIEPEELMSGEFLKDLNETISMLRRPFGESRKLLTKIVKSQKRHLGKSTANLAKATANAWLEHRYGWGPIVRDIYSISSLTEKICQDTNRTRKVVRASEQQHFEKAVCIDANLPVPNWIRAQGTCVRKQSLRAHAGVIYDLESRLISQQLASYLGYRPTDMLSTFWECLPMTFVLDWFLNTGNWLRSFAVQPGVTILGEWVTTVEETTTSMSSGSLTATFPFGTNPVFRGSFPGSEQKHVQFTRNVHPIRPPTPTFEVSSLSGLRCLDAASLSVTRILSKLRKIKVDARVYTD